MFTLIEFTSTRTSSLFGSCPKFHCSVLHTILLCLGCYLSDTEGIRIHISLPPCVPFPPPVSYMGKLNSQPHLPLVIHSSLQNLSVSQLPLSLLISLCSFLFLAKIWEKKYLTPWTLKYYIYLWFSPLPIGISPNNVFLMRNFKH